MIIDFLIVSGATALLAVVAMMLTACAARRTGRVSVVDVTWGLGLTATALLAALLGDGDPVRRWLLLGAVAVWGLRLSWHVWRRSRGAPEDPRYLDLLDGGPGKPRRSPLLKVWVPQCAAIWLVSLPVQASAVLPSGWTPLVVVGGVVWAIGVFFEAVGDAQLAAYKRDPDRPPVMDRGLWGWTRHPNYFGDACVWWGIWLVAAAAGWPALTVISPLAMTWFLAYGTGARLLERTVMNDRPGYLEYAERVPMFFPRPSRG